MDGPTPTSTAVRPERRRRLPLCWASFALALAIAHAAAQSEPAPRTDPFAFGAPPPQLLVLFDGRVLRGRISDRPGGYMIEHAAGTEVIPYEFIRLTAASLDDAYIKQRDGLTKPTAGDHLQLAQWCCEHQLYAQAAEQLTAALKLEPNRSEARALLQKIADASPEQVGGSVRFIAEPRPRQHAPTGISTETQAEFVRRVQPILINRCGDARCHGSAATNSLKLINVRTGRRQQRLETEANLAAVLRQIDRQQPDNSALLRAPQQSDTPAHRGVFAGQAGPAQLERLRTWVAQAARELPAEPAPQLWVDSTATGVVPAEFSAVDSPPTAPPVVQQAIHQPDLESPLLIEIPRTPRTDPDAGAVKAGDSPAIAAPVDRRSAAPGVPDRRPPAAAQATADDRAAFLRNILQQDRPDAFDPNEFNRQVHGDGAPP